jgi:hypothetical protein
MRALIMTVILAAVAPLYAQVTPSQQLKEKFLAILRNQVTEMISSSGSASSSDETSRQIEAVMTEINASYGPLLTLPENEAARLLTTDPDDRANSAAMRRDIELWKKVQRPLPVLYKRMQDDVENGTIKGGLELELTRRISEFHLHQLGMF